MEHYRYHQSASDPEMYAPPDAGRQSRQVPADQQGLKQHEAKGNNPCESGQYVDRTAPCEQRARCCCGDRH